MYQCFMLLVSRYDPTFVRFWMAMKFKRRSSEWVQGDEDKIQADMVKPEVNSNAGNIGIPVFLSVTGRMSHSVKTVAIVSHITWSAKSRPGQTLFADLLVRNKKYNGITRTAFQIRIRLYLDWPHQVSCAHPKLEHDIAQDGTPLALGRLLHHASSTCDTIIHLGPPSHI